MTYTVTCLACCRSFPVQHQSSRPETFLCRDCKTLAALSTAHAVAPGAFDDSADALAREIVADILQGGNVDRMQWAQYFDDDAADEPTDPIARIIVGDDDDDEPTATVQVFVGLSLPAGKDCLAALQAAREPLTYADWRAADSVVMSYIERDRRQVWTGVIGLHVFVWIPEQ